MDYGYLATVLNTPAKVMLFENKHLRFITETPGTFYSPEELLRRGGGDCDGNAVFACDLLLRNGFAFMGESDALPGAAPLNVEWVQSDPRGGHAVCVYREPGQPFFYIDNTMTEWGIRRGPFNSIAEIVQDMATRSNGNWRWYGFFTTDYQFGFKRVDR
jgi:hypothetical protein